MECVLLLLFGHGPLIQRLPESKEIYSSCQSSSQARMHVHNSLLACMLSGLNSTYLLPVDPWQPAPVDFADCCYGLLIVLPLYWFAALASTSVSGRLLVNPLQLAVDPVQQAAWQMSLLAAMLISLTRAYTKHAEDTCEDRIHITSMFWGQLQLPICHTAMQRQK